jgi:tetratricopeptide (TPR) repeat protein
LGIARRGGYNALINAHLRETAVSRSSKPPPAPLTTRIARARAEGRTQQALELTRELYKHSHSPEDQELLRQVLLERGGQLQQQGHTRDAATVYGNLLDLGGTPEFRAGVAERLAACGDFARALRALGPEPDSRARQRILGHAADAALRQGPGGRATLPAELQPGFDAVMQAFAHAEAGRDEEARAALQPIGLASPFLEWKLLLRGLVAYYGRDDARAVENWQRLDAQRLPARLAAPLRLGIDPAFRAAQPAATQQALQQQATRLAGPGPATGLRELRRILADSNKSLGSAFRQAEGLLPILRHDYPRLVPRLAHCLFWAIVEQGQPEDLDRYRRAFGPLATEAEVHRMEALALERREMWPEAHRAWQDFLRAVAADPAWPGEVGQRAQALVWERMGHNAEAREREADKDVPYILSLYYDQPKPLSPGPEECFERSIKLAPERLESYLALFHLHRAKGRTAKARKVGQQLLKRFPDHAQTSEALGDLALETQEPARAHEFFEKALTANPLERRLRGKLARARQNLGLERALEKQFDAARAEYEAALALGEVPPAPLLCQWAVMEMKAGQPGRAAELIARAGQVPDQRLAVRYALLSAGIRAKLPPTERQRLADELAAALAEPPTPAEALALLQSAADQRQRKLDAFRGQKTHERTFLRFLDKVPLKKFGEADLERLCGYLQALDARRPWERCLKEAEGRFSKNPSFALSYADFYLTRREPERNLWFIKHHLDRARQLVQGLPREAQDRYLPAIRHREERVRELDDGRLDMFSALDRMMGGPGPEGDDEEWI